MPLGYLLAVAPVAVCTAAALAPRGRRSYPRYLLALVVNEIPVVPVLWLVAATWLALGQGDVDAPAAWAVAAPAAVTAVGLLRVAAQGLRAADAVSRGLDTGLGTAWRATPRAARPATAGLRRWLRLARVTLTPVALRGRGVERVANISYGDAGPRNLLDLYRRRASAPDGPTLVYLHGGSFRRGRKSRESLALLHRLARLGWVCLSATYRFSPAASYEEQLTDVKKVIAWARTEGARYGASPVVVVAGSSAGAHLAAMAALTPGDPAFQPGFEGVDTAVSAAVCLYGYYGSIDGAPSAPPFFVAHGDRDSLITVDHARAFVARLRCTSAHPVVYAELPGGQHGFDLFRSPRFEAVVDGVEAFAATVLPGRRADAAPARPVAGP